MTTDVRERVLELLAEEVAKLKDGPEAFQVKVSCEMKVGLPAFLPEDYVPDINLRLFFYKRIASSRSREELEDAEAWLGEAGSAANL